jgi:branched-chain amino acid transport system permease protein
VIFIQGFMVEGLRFLGDWRSLLFGALIVGVMLVRPGGVIGRALPWPGRRSRKPDAFEGATRHA